MSNVIEFPKVKKEEHLVGLLTRALSLNNHFLDLALGRQAFAKNTEEQDNVMDLLEANQVLLTEARRKE